MKKLLAGDIGGTNCRLTLCDHAPGQIEVCETEVFPSQEFGSFDEILKEFLGDKAGQVVAACFGVPGPVVNEQVRVTNLPWTISTSSLKSLLSCEQVCLMNDLAATIAGVNELSDDQKKLIHAGSASNVSDSFAIVAPGTGLGQAAMIGDTIIASEGGHVEFSPRNERDFRLQEYLKKSLQCTRVSFERLVSGPGLENIFHYLSEVEGLRPTPSTQARIDKNEDLAAVVGEVGLSGDDLICAEAVKLFITYLAVHCSNVILTYVASGGLYLGGGISAKLLPILKTDHFLSTMQNKGRLTPLIQSTPVYVITEKFSGLFGALHIAKKLANAS
jgi:glucokinase